MHAKIKERHRSFLWADCVQYIAVALLQNFSKVRSSVEGFSRVNMPNPRSRPDFQFTLAYWPCRYLLWRWKSFRISDLSMVFISAVSGSSMENCDHSRVFLGGGDLQKKFSTMVSNFDPFIVFSECFVREWDRRSLRRRSLACTCTCYCTLSMSDLLQ